MVVLSALRRTPGTLAANPVLFVPVFVLLLFQVPQTLLQAVNPLLASVVSLAFSLVFVFVTPFFQAGLVAMADEALDGATSLSRFVEAGTEHYVSMLVAYLVLVGANFALGIVVFVAFLVGGVALLGGGGSSRLVVLAVVGVVVLVGGLAYLLVVFFVQFYGQAIVLDDHGAVDALKHSYGVVRANVTSTLGYSVVVGVAGGVVGAAFGLVSVLLRQPAGGVSAVGGMAGAGGMAGSGGMAALPLTTALVLAAGTTVVGTLFGGFVAVYSVAFYRSLTRDATDSNSNTAPHTDATE